jgi:hypothetical protein
MAVRVAARHPDSARIELRAIGLGRVTAVPADVRDQSSVAAAIAGADAVVNTVSAYVEKNGVTFEAVHVQAATAPLASVWLPSESIAPAPTLFGQRAPTLSLAGRRVGHLSGGAAGRIYAHTA